MKRDGGVNNCFTGIVHDSHKVFNVVNGAALRLKRSGSLIKRVHEMDHMLKEVNMYVVGQDHNVLPYNQAAQKAEKSSKFKFEDNFFKNVGVLCKRLNETEVCTEQKIDVVLWSPCHLELKRQSTEGSVDLEVEQAVAQELKQLQKSLAQMVNVEKVCCCDKCSKEYLDLVVRFLDPEYGTRSIVALPVLTPSFFHVKGVNQMSFLLGIPSSALLEDCRAVCAEMTTYVRWQV